MSGTAGCRPPSPGWRSSPGLIFPSSAAPGTARLRAGRPGVIRPTVGRTKSAERVEKPPYPLAEQRLGRIDGDDAGTVPGMDQHRPLGDDAAMGEAAPDP